MLRFFSDEDFLVKSTTPLDGESSLRENVMETVDFFLYPEGKTDQNAVYHERLSNVLPSTWNTISLSTAFVTGVLCPNKAKTFRVYAIANYTSAIVNGNDYSHTSVAELEALTRDIDIDSETGGIKCPQNSFLMSTDGAFQVTGVNSRVSMVAKGDVKLKRVAAKISFVVRVEEEVKVPNIVTINGNDYSRTETWRPRTDQMEIYLVNGSGRGQVSGQPLTGAELFTYQSLSVDDTRSETHNYSSYTLRVNGEGKPVDSHGHVINGEGKPLDDQGNVITAEGDVDYVYDLETKEGVFHPSEYPFYSYPETWEYGSPEEPYLKLMIPWDRDAGIDSGGNRFGAISKNYYYRIYCPGTPIDGTHAQFLRNNWYKVILNVSILGSEADGGILNIDGSYYVVDWQEKSNGSGSGSGSGGGTDTDKDAEIKGARYLFLNREEYWLYNIDELVVPFITSDVCAITGFKATRNVFSGSTKTTETITNAADWGISLETVTTSTGAHFRYSHALNNDTTTHDYDVSEYTIEFTLYQVGQSTTGAYAKKIIIHQYPAIRIDLQWNSGSDDTNKGYAYVNASTKNTSGQAYWTSSSIQTNWTYYLGSAPGSGTSSNNNRNMVVIETTVLPSDSEYMLGDPRLSDIDNLNSDWPNSNKTTRESEGSWSYTSPSIDPGNRKILYYYPVNRDHAADNIIAPKFRIASSWGATQPVAYANAFRRCASYQEDGYPAGRWRLPTVAEIQYITKLNADGKIQRLLGSESLYNNQNQREETTKYWCNSGYAIVYNGTNAQWQAYQGIDMPMPVLGTDASLVNATTPQSGNYVYIRCVYDDWYWDNFKVGNTDISTVTKNVFTWGDRSR